METDVGRPNTFQGSSDRIVFLNESHTVPVKNQQSIIVNNVFFSENTREIIPGIFPFILNLESCFFFFFSQLFHISSAFLFKKKKALF